MENKYLQELERYFEETPQEQLDKDWKEIHSKAVKTDITVDDYVEYVTNMPILLHGQWISERDLQPTIATTINYGKSSKNIK